MSAKSEQLQKELDGVENEVCASCGIAAVDDVKLKDCNNGCDLVKYCSDGCQENHREQHEQECKKRKAELHDKELFTQNDGSYMGECPLCFLPLSIDLKKSTRMSCCSKWICNGCDYANKKRENEQGLEQRCAFCRNPAPKSMGEIDKNIMKRIKKNDPNAMTDMGKKHEKEGEYGKALEYYTKAAELGDMDAHACLATLYDDGDGVEKDIKKAVYHFEQAAIGGHPQARGILALLEMDNCRFERAAKHFIIAANLGCDVSLEQVKELFMKGVVSKEEYAGALRGYQTAVDATKSTERDEAEAFHGYNLRGTWCSFLSILP